QVVVQFLSAIKEFDGIGKTVDFKSGGAASPAGFGSGFVKSFFVPEFVEKTVLADDRMQAVQSYGQLVVQVSSVSIRGFFARNQFVALQACQCSAQSNFIQQMRQSAFGDRTFEECQQRQ